MLSQPPSAIHHRSKFRCSLVAAAFRSGQHRMASLFFPLSSRQTWALLPRKLPAAASVAPRTKTAFHNHCFSKAVNLPFLRFLAKGTNGPQDASRPLEPSKRPASSGLLVAPGKAPMPGPDTQSEGETHVPTGNHIRKTRQGARFSNVPPYIAYAVRYRPRPQGPKEKQKMGGGIGVASRNTGTARARHPLRDVQGPSPARINSLRGSRQELVHCNRAGRNPPPIERNQP